MTNLIEATLLRRISDLERYIGWVQQMDRYFVYDGGLGSQSGNDLLTHLRRELATERGNLRRLRRENMEGDLYWERVTLDTGQPWPGEEGAG